ncbi:MAG: hypothetical protein ACK4RG_00655 [Fimbriimonadales bacterium]
MLNYLQGSFHLVRNLILTYRYVAVLPFILVFLFGAQFLYYRMRGGYKAVEIGGH